MRRLWDNIERLQASGGDEKEIGQLRNRVTFIERQLGIEPTGPGARQAPRSEGALPAQQEQPGNTAQRGDATADQPAGPYQQEPPLQIHNPPLADDESAYREAYALFRNGSLDEAVRMFEAFLKDHPKSRLASSAVYGIGEARFNQGRFDEAVLQFDRVIKEFPGSNKELSALLKQGQAFEKMGDTRSARIIFQKIIADYPHTAQARIASGRLKALPPSGGDHS